MTDQSSEGLTLERLALTAGELRKHSGRLKKVETLTALLLSAQAPERTNLVYFLCGELPMGKIGVGPSLVHQLSQSELSFAGQERSLSCVVESFHELKDLSGPGSKKRRFELLRSLLESQSQEAGHFLLRLLGGGLRQGALAGVVEQAVAKASEVSPKLLRRAVTLTGSLPRSATIAFQSGEAGLGAIKMELFRALSPMLAATAESVEDTIEKEGELFWEQKLDGARIQVHRSKDQVRVFSRALREVTSSVPEVVEHALSLKAEDFILDGEVLSYDVSGRPRPFQQIMRRFGRAKASSKLRSEMPLTPRYFDILYLDGEEMMDKPFLSRRKALESLVGGASVEGHSSQNPVSILKFLEQTMADGLEGLMAKRLNSVYQCGKRGKAWFKLKPFHTLDLVVLAAEWGSGRRRGYLSNIHLGTYCEQREKYLMLGKTFKGMTDAMLSWQTEKFLALEMNRDNYTVYLKPSVVVEVAFNELQTSKQYDSGLALRFARVKTYREDKSVEQADNYEQVLKLAQLKQS